MAEEKKENPEKLKFIYSEHNPPCFYVHGARGGPTSVYDFRIDFYIEKKRSEDIEIHTKDGKSEDSFSRTDEEYDEYIVVDREIQVSILLSLPAAKELSSWLTKRLDEFENLIKSVEEEKNSN
jgi:hypothetical protein